MYAYVYRRPHDYRAVAPPQRLAFGAYYALGEASGSPTYLLASKHVHHTGVFRRSYTVAPRAVFRPPLNQDPQGSASLIFTASGTLSSVIDTTMTLLALTRAAKERVKWTRERWDDSAIRAFDPLYTSWQPNGSALLKFTPSGTLLDLLLTDGSATLSLTASGTLTSVGNLSGSASLTFDTVANTGNLQLLSGATTLSLSASGTLNTIQAYAGSATITFNVAAAFDTPYEGSTSLSFSTSGSLDTIFGQKEIVPYLIGATDVSAIQKIMSIHCFPFIEGNTGTVTAQDPEAFTLIDRGATITITLGGAFNNGRRDRPRGQRPYNTRIH